MSAQNAKDAADNFVAGLRMPSKPSTEKRKFQLVTFTSDADCRFFYPRRALNWQLQFNTYISRLLRERHGIRVQRVSLTVDDYTAAARSRPAVFISQDAPPPKFTPRDFADSHLHFIDL